MPRARLNIEGLDPIDTHVGGKVRMRRLMLGLSQDELAKVIGLTFQQVQKYERGTNRISVSRLLDIARALKVPYNYFLDGCAGMAIAPKTLLRGVGDNKQDDFEVPSPVLSRDALELLRAYSSIETPKLKKQLLEMAKAMAGADKAVKKA